MCENHNSRTAAEAGWHVSRYNLFAPVPGTDQTAVANLFKGTCTRYSPAEIFLLDNVESLDENHPILELFAERGLIVNFDELQALQSIGRCVCGAAPEVNLTICPTMACNFACPYCFEEHRSGRMSQEVQDDVLELTRRMLKASHAKSLVVTWFGGEPLLAPDVIETLSQRFMALAEEFSVSCHADLITNGYLLTQPVADMLERCIVRYAQITLDGVGPAHDATHHLRPNCG